MQLWGTITALTRSAGREMSYYQLRDAVFSGNAQAVEVLRSPHISLPWVRAKMKVLTHADVC